MASRKDRLAQARSIKKQSARLMRLIEKGRAPIEQVLMLNHRALNSVRVHTLMCKVPHLGEKGVQKLLTDAEVWPMTRVGELTLKERERIIAHLPPRARS